MPLKPSPYRPVMPNVWSVPVLLLPFQRATAGRFGARSGMDVNSRITRGAGLIDRDYRGELKVLLINRSATAYEIRRGDRIAQLVITAIATPDVVEFDELDDTERNAGGFGSTGQ